MIQSLLNIIYRYPKAAIKRYNRFGGYISYRKMMANQRLMKKAANHLPPVTSFADGLPVYFLTGKKYLYQTLFCIRSLTCASNEKFRFILIDDGSFDAAFIRQIQTALPGADVITSAIIEENLKKTLPANSYTLIQNKRRVYPHLKKLTDIHTLADKGWKLVLDSDMLFMKDPIAILNWLKKPDQPIHMIDCIESYGYSQKLMEQLTGNPIPAMLNVGIIGLNSASINWTLLSDWIANLEEKEGTSYYLEQALSAMLVAGKLTISLPAADYLVNPGAEQSRSFSGVLHHYVDLSKKEYYNQAWKRFI